MLQYFQHPAFEANRHARRIHKAFAQLWGTADLWVTTDRVGFNVPERDGWPFPGPDLHWDVSLKTPIPFGTQGILYLTDTLPEQGALTLVPGFHRRADDWLASLPHGAAPRRQDLHALGAQPIGGRAGDLVIWHHALPHGSPPNRATRPRVVQYIAMYPSRSIAHDGWIYDFGQIARIAASTSLSSSLRGIPARERTASVCRVAVARYASAVVSVSRGISPRSFALSI